MFILSQFDMVYWTGDLMGHDVWRQTRKDVEDTLDFLTGLFLKYFPHIPVYASVGNHEGVPVNRFNINRSFSVLHPRCIMTRLFIACHMFDLELTFRVTRIIECFDIWNF